MSTSARATSEQGDLATASWLGYHAARWGERRSAGGLAMHAAALAPGGLVRTIDPRAASRPLARAAARTLTALALVAGLGAVVGCAETRPAQRSDTLPRIEPARPPQRYDPAPIIEVRKVFLDGRHAGYYKIRLDETHQTPVRIVMLYDLTFDLRGFQTAGGATFESVRDTFVEHGPRRLEGAVRLLLGGDFDTDVRFEPMERPWTLEDAPTNG